MLQILPILSIWQILSNWPIVSILSIFPKCHLCSWALRMVLDPSLLININFVIFANFVNLFKMSILKQGLDKSGRIQTFLLNVKFEVLTSIDWPFNCPSNNFLINNSQNVYLTETFASLTLCHLSVAGKICRFNVNAGITRKAGRVKS